MIEARYTDAEWQKIAEAAGHWISDRGREALERAMYQYLSSRPVALSMKNAAQQRDQWQAARKKAESLSDDIRKLGLWDTWDIDGEFDPDGERATLLETLGSFVKHATCNELEFDKHAKDFCGQRDPRREDLYQEVLRVWVDDLGNSLTWSLTGPLVGFFRAAVTPFLEEDTPTSKAIRSIVNREKARRKGCPVASGAQLAAE
ncbi:hypothetical protein [Nitrobacter sp.]|uniref:hypothetical protein n=1 Tax=Nitrobacter sp. TaxID=29420 RepID=UPI0029CAC375|nr:hypothetical protein [Nitrobacter sp.]